MHELEHYDFSQEMDRMVNLLTDKENDILINMIDKCENLEYSNNPHFDACDYAFELEKCWKRVDPEVIAIFILLNTNKINSHHDYLFIVIILYDVTALLHPVNYSQKPKHSQTSRRWGIFF